MLAPLHADVAWARDGSIQMTDGTAVALNAGYALSSWTAHDLARIGYLYLQRGADVFYPLLMEMVGQSTATPVPAATWERVKRAR